MDSRKIPVAKRNKSADDAGGDGGGSYRPWADRSTRFELDQLLRDHGFKIEARPNNGPAIWRRGDRTFTVSGALRLLDPRLVKDARYAEDLYRDGIHDVEGD